jgi:hypothetical protein
LLAVLCSGHVLARSVGRTAVISIGAGATLVMIGALWFAVNRALAYSLRDEDPGVPVADRVAARTASWRDWTRNRNSMSFPDLAGGANAEPQFTRGDDPAAARVSITPRNWSKGFGSECGH